MGRGFFPAVLAIGMGVFTGYYTFQPALRELQYEKSHGPGSAFLGQSTDRKESPPAAGNDSGAASASSSPRSAVQEEQK
ncbi:hypothetical protein ASPWEDRAFT_175690 [Aspergillus wentii DTO 134E9]|uniref:Uncharacterized protein n=1 Tax=Aspergillus wentii DTO 134E9 TaxID=1073089 RepID=A0A1L9RBX4_ASPWE|nr:uncharacterized protein ASPWEDRAFT_175690 [Aspergillus wentii DTO 134E9]KAI9934971.1 hypothetical protein MW887_000592 [Aspergillus wentii]OJJ32412.1 hypothetical protein ASPWEDRAFT_175690 [Aspergillus wentii DTO 134E9]